VYLRGVTRNLENGESTAASYRLRSRLARLFSQDGAGPRPRTILARRR